MNPIPKIRTNEDMCVVTGFSKNLYKNILNLENYTQETVMLEIIGKYQSLIK